MLRRNFLGAIASIPFLGTSVVKARQPLKIRAVEVMPPKLWKAIPTICNDILG